MQITLKNKELVPAVNFLQSLSLKASDSRHRSKFVKDLSKGIEDLSQSEQDLLSEIGLLNERGEVDESNQELVKEYNKVRKDLLEEKVVFDGGIHAKSLEMLSVILINLEIELSGIDAEIYDRLLDEFEKNLTEKANN
ncbi:hypothetical protein [Floricoccus penangensis]|uniref:hypothetical protein n=1 Tax=Floricoccus penangensis TaxID=1859475 RepID=UPI00204193E8|nr:hypothetical protein [Floricoccus penangensis]URZ87559.1 hypothetical protein KIW23_00475 [Floricoccus penangensis]